MLGILGGLGPLASAEFLKTIYEYNSADLEQRCPSCILYSDPTFPDRTTAIASGGSDGILLNRLMEAIERLCQAGATKIVIACVTIHYLLPRIPSQHRERVISLVDLVIDEVLSAKRKYLLLATVGTRQANIFQAHDRWDLAAQYIVFPSGDDQDQIHKLIYQLKSSGSSDSAIACLDAILRRYEIDGFIVGCTEFHLLTKHLIKQENSNQKYYIVDPLLTFAKHLRRFVGADI